MELYHETTTDQDKSLSQRLAEWNNPDTDIFPYNAKSEDWTPHTKTRQFIPIAQWHREKGRIGGLMTRDIRREKVHGRNYKIINMWKLGHTQKEIAEDASISLRQVKRIVKDVPRIYNHISSFSPNAVTIAAMKEARQRRGLPQFTNMQALFDDLHADD